MIGPATGDLGQSSRTRSQGGVEATTATGEETGRNDSQGNKSLEGKDAKRNIIGPKIRYEFRGF